MSNKTKPLSQTETKAIVDESNTSNTVWHYLENSLANATNTRSLKPSLTSKNYLNLIRHIEEDETDCLLGYN